VSVAFENTIRPIEFAKGCAASLGRVAFPWTLLAPLTVLFCVRVDLLIGLIILRTNRFAGHIARVVMKRPFRALARFLLLVRSAIVVGHMISFHLFTTTASNRALFLRANSRSQFETNLRRGRQAEGIAKAKAVGVYKGRPPSIEASRVREIKAQGMRPVDIAKALKIGRASVYRVLGTGAG
jgi:DNA invertase Pin-like site-specific DNA recombinase